VTSEVTATLNEIIDGIEKLGGLIQEVSMASDQQSQGINEINCAVGQLDQLTQTNAASAEESASASEEMSGQARELDKMVQALASLLVGSDRRAGEARMSGATRNHNEFGTPRSKEEQHPAQVVVDEFGLDPFEEADSVITSR